MSQYRYNRLLYIPRTVITIMLAMFVQASCLAAPPTPTGVAAVAGNTQVALSWSASSGATSYNVLATTTTGGGYSTVGSPATTSFTNTGLTNGVSYYYVINAVNGTGTSANSTEVFARPDPVGLGLPNILAVGSNFWYLDPTWTGEVPWIPSVVNRSLSFATAFSGYANGLAPTNIWSNAFLSEIQPYGTLRFMNWGSVNCSNQTTWSTRQQPTAANQDAEVEVLNGTSNNPPGIAYEWMIDLCNRTNCNMWICVPHESTSDYWTGLAQLVFNNLKPGLKVYVEYSNETWNPSFAQNAYVVAQGHATIQSEIHSSGQGADYEAGFKYHVYEACKIFGVFDSIFGVNSPRVMKVISGQDTNAWAAGLQVQALNDPVINPANQKPQCYAIAPYVGYGLSGSDANIITEMNAATTAEETNTVAIQSVLAGTGMNLVAYESGQTLTTNAQSFATNAGAKQWYYDYLTMIQRHYSLINLYANCSTWQAFGDWGAVDATGMPESLAPKYQGIHYWIDDHLGTPQVPSAPTSLAATPGPGSVALTWTASATGAVNYNVYRSTASAGLNGSTPIAFGLATPGYTDFNAAPGTTYYYEVAGVNNAGVGSPSNIVSAVANSISSSAAAILQTSTQPALDANPADAVWANAAHYSLNNLICSVQNCSVPATASYQALWDANNLYFMVQVTNPAPLVANTPLYNGDAVEIYIDSNDSKQTGYGPSDFQYTFGWNNPAFTEEYSHTTGVQFAQQNTANGYAMEMIIPWTTLGATPVVNKVIGLDAAIDYAPSATTGRTGKLFWNATADNDWQNPSLFGYGQLTSNVTTPPSAPTGLTATSGNAQVGLSWAASSGAASYSVYRGITAGGENATAIATGISATSYTDTGLTNGTAYYYTVKAVNSAGTSGASNEASATPQISIPAPPTGLAATPGNAQIALAWNASSGATSYSVYRGTAAGGENATAIATGIATTSYTNTGLTNGTAYFYTVKAVNSAGTSAASNEASATPIAAPAPPTALTATAGNAQVALSWTASGGATGYNVLRSTVSGSGYASVATGIAVTTYTNTGLTNGTAYFFVVTATNAAGTSGNSNEASATPQVGAPPAPTGLTATPGNGQVGFSWTASSGATSYSVYRGTTAGGESGTAIATGVGTTSYTDTGLTNGTTYYYTVKAVNAGGTSGASNEASATPTASTGVMLASEPFTEATGALNGANGGTGWASAWLEQSGSNTVPGYNVAGTSAMAYTGLSASGNYGVGGLSYQSIGRALDVTPGGSFGANGYLTGSLIGASGKTLWFSALMRKDSSNTNPIQLQLVNNNTNGSQWVLGTALDMGGYFTTGNSFWSMEVNGTVYPSSVPITVGSTTLLVMSVTFGTTTTVSLYVNPTSLGGGAPSPTLTQTTTTSMAFNSMVYMGGYAAGDSSIDEARIGTAYGTVTPTSGGSAPGAPTGLTATSGNTQVALAWNASTGATSYSVYRGTTAGGESGTAIATGVGTTTYTNTGLTNGTTYYYTVKAVNATGTSGASNEASATPSAPSSPPAPTGLTATPGNAQVALAWNSSTGATTYNVLRSTVSGSGYAAVVSQAGLTYTNTGLTNGTTYYFVVTATNANGTSGNSNQASATPQVSAPPAPSGLAGTSGTAQVALSWNSSTGATSYSVYRGTTSGGESGTAIATGIATTSYTDTGLTNGTTYYYTVKAVNAGGTSAASNEASATPSAGGGGTMLGTEPFAEATGAMHNANGGTGWNGAWNEQNGSTATPGYDIINTTPLTYTGIPTSGNYGVGGLSFQSAGRWFDVTAGGNYGSNGYVTSSLIGASGKTLWFSALMRKDGTSQNPNSLQLLNNSTNWAIGNTLDVGYFGSSSESGGIKYWSLELNGTVTRTSVPITTGSTALIVMSVTFGATNTVNLYVNPTSLGGSAPAPTLTQTTTSSLAFNSLVYLGGYTTGESSIDEIRLGTTYAVVTP